MDQAGQSIAIILLLLLMREKMLYYTIPGGKMNRGLTVLHSLEKLKGRPLKEEEVFEAHVLGWCVEWLQAFFLISDDIMDQSVTRRGQPCYYLSPHPLAHPKVRAREHTANDSLFCKTGSKASDGW